MATNAARYRIVAGPVVKLLEFGLRRAQGPDGGLSSSKYAYIGKCAFISWMNERKRAKKNNLSMTDRHSNESKVYLWCKSFIHTFVKCTWTFTSGANSILFDGIVKVDHMISASEHLFWHECSDICLHIAGRSKTQVSSILIYNDHESYSMQHYSCSRTFITHIYDS